ncbi:MAG: hypothetical protein JXB14_08085 [Candidatus Altiarchaeota archaeon]|nr:hypothetical protein [Candidatus Altiarchaeota archaeon]
MPTKKPSLTQGWGRWRAYRRESAPLRRELKQVSAFPRKRDSITGEFESKIQASQRMPDTDERMRVYYHGQERMTARLKALGTDVLDRKEARKKELSAKLDGMRRRHHDRLYRLLLHFRIKSIQQKQGFLKAYINIYKSAKLRF